MSNIAIRVENLSKQYRIGARQESYKTLREQVTHGFKSLFSRNGDRLSVSGHPSSLHGHRSPVGGPDDTIWALKDVSFEIKQGEVVGIIGRNGAGKSTLLKILSRITEPAEGQAEIHGRVGSLLEVGTGFHPELTGRENIYLNAAILGMKKVEIERKFDEIVAFAEIEKFIDTPVKHYSTGMYLRLAFAVAAHLDTEILLVDEVLAVGDAAFQKKCLGKMSDVAKNGRTVLFVSHNMAAVSVLCNSAMLLTGGRITHHGTTQDIISEYLSELSTNFDTPLSTRQDRIGNGKLRFRNFLIRDAKGKPISIVRTGQDVTFELTFNVTDNLMLKNVAFQISFLDIMGQRLFYLLTSNTGENFAEISNGDHAMCRVPFLPLLPGTYTLDLIAKDAHDAKPIDQIYGAVKLEVVMDDVFGSGKLPKPDGGSIVVPHKWYKVGATNNVVNSKFPKN